MEKTDRRIVRIYRTILLLLLATILMGVGCYQYYTYYMQLPDAIRIHAGNEHILEMNIPAKAIIYEDSLEVGGFMPSNIPEGAVEIDFNEENTLLANEVCEYEMDVKLFGFLPLKTVSLEVVSEQKVIPAGIPIGIYVKTDGVLVIGTGAFTGIGGNEYEPSKNILKSGDYIQCINGTEVTTKNDVVEALQIQEGKNAVIEVLRNQEFITVSVETVKCDDGDYKIGVWLRDSAQGIGTLTFLDEEGHFGALGHGITDVDTTTLMDMDKGTLYQTSIVAIHKGQRGTPGELTGSIDYAPNHVIGDILTNTEVGIYGNSNEKTRDQISNEAIPVGYSSEVKVGPAQILCTITGTCESYDVNILSIDYASDDDHRSMVVEIVDEELLSLTGGIVQGMSGAPIIQNGKLIGAVTHVMVNDPTRGYGIFIENMLETAESIEN